MNVLSDFAYRSNVARLLRAESEKRHVGMLLGSYEMDEP